MVVGFSKKKLSHNFILDFTHLDYRLDDNNAYITNGNLNYFHDDRREGLAKFLTPDFFPSYLPYFQKCTRISLKILFTHKPVSCKILFHRKR